MVLSAATTTLNGGKLRRGMDGPWKLRATLVIMLVVFVYIFYGKATKGYVGIRKHHLPFFSKQSQK